MPIQPNAQAIENLREGGRGRRENGRVRTEGENKEREGKKGGRGRTRKKRDEEGMGEVGG